MAQFAPVCPPQIAHALKERNLLGKYHLVLAHDIALRPETYEGLYSGLYQTVILDNGVAELGYPVTLDVMRTAMQVVQPTTVVLPDAYLDTYKTIQNCRHALVEWPPELPPDTRFMIVPQGKTLKDFIRCAEAFKDSPEINYWGVPRNLVDWIGTRRDAILACRLLNPNRKIHMLGFSDDLFDDVKCARYLSVEGIDSAVPLRAASLNISLSLALEIPERGNWFDTAQYTNVMGHNLAIVREWVRGHSL